MQTKRSWRTIVNAFWRALQMTLQGQTYTSPPPAHPELRAWIEQGKFLLKAVFHVADTQGLNETARKQRIFMLEGRPMSMQTILSSVEHNFSREYSLLLDSGLEHIILTLTAFNMNDIYRLTQLTESLTDVPELQKAVMDLETHLSTMPRTSAKS